MFLFISLLVLLTYYIEGWTTIGPGLLFCLFAMLAEAMHSNKIIKREL